MMKWGYQAKWDRKETPIGEFLPSLQDPERRMYQQHRPPENDFQAMMEALPLADIPMTAEEREADWLGFEAKLERAGLTPRERLVLDCIVFGGMSLARTAVVVAQAEGLSRAPAKMQVSRWRDRAYNKLRVVFSERNDDE